MSAPSGGGSHLECGWARCDDRPSYEPEYERSGEPNGEPPRRLHGACGCSRTKAAACQAVVAASLVLCLAVSHLRSLPVRPHARAGPAGALERRATVAEPETSFEQAPSWLGAPARLWQTAQDDGSPLGRRPDVLLRPDFSFVGVTVRLTGNPGQKLAGFGGAFTPGAARAFEALSAERRQEVLEALFGESGSRLSLARAPLGEAASGKEAREDSKAILSMIKAAEETVASRGGRLRLVGSPAFSAEPAQGQPAAPCSRPGDHAALAELYDGWVGEYSSSGVHLWGVATRPRRLLSSSASASGPDSPWPPPCREDLKDAEEFIRNHLGPKLHESHPDTVLYVYDRRKEPPRYPWSTAVLTSAQAIEAGVAFQWYSGDQLEAPRAPVRLPLPRPAAHAGRGAGRHADRDEEAAEAAALRRGRHPQPTVLRGLDEGAAAVDAGPWAVAEGFAHDVLGSLSTGGEGWIAADLLAGEPGMVLVGDEGAAIMAVQDGQLQRRPLYQHMGHFSRFLPPGSAVLESSVFPTPLYGARAARASGRCGAEDGLQAAAFLRPDGLLAVVALNCGDSETEFKILDEDSSRAMLTSIPAHAIQTYIFERSGSSPFWRGGAAGGDPALGQVAWVGVNVGGWLLLENWMWGSEMYEVGIRDEYTLTKVNGGPQSLQAINLIQSHWANFLTEQDLDRLQAWGVSHIRVPIGYWLVDYRAEDGFVDGGELYLRRLLGWLQPRGMRALLDLHALPGAQTASQSFTGRMSDRAGFFLDRRHFKRGKRAMLKLAQLVRQYESNPLTAGVVLGIELVNEPDWSYWNPTPLPKGTSSIRSLYEEMVPRLRKLLPPERYAIFLSFMGSPHIEAADWLAKVRDSDPATWSSVVFDKHIYHAYGDDDKPDHEWQPYVDSCKTCCRDPVLLEPMVENNLLLAIGEYALNTGFGGTPDFYTQYMQEQLSLWANVPKMVGSFFWNFKVLRRPDALFGEFSLLDLLQPAGPIPPVSQMDLSAVCPGQDRRLCPAFHPATTMWNDDCTWQPGVASGGFSQTDGNSTHPIFSIPILVAQ